MVEDGAKRRCEHTKERGRLGSAQKPLWDDRSFRLHDARHSHCDRTLRPTTRRLPVPLQGERKTWWRFPPNSPEIHSLSVASPRAGACPQSLWLSASSLTASPLTASTQKSGQPESGSMPQSLWLTADSFLAESYSSYIAAITASPNSEVFTSVAPSIRRAKS